MTDNVCTFFAVTKGKKAVIGSYDEYDTYKDEIQAVSYTHLDVYKRQQLHRVYNATIWNGNLQAEKPENKKPVMRYLWASIKMCIRDSIIER